MTNKEKAEELGQKYFPNEYNVWARPNYEAQCVELACLEIIEWKEQQLIEKAVKYINNTIGQGGWINSCQMNNFIEDFKKAMEE